MAITRMQQKRGTAAEWNAENPILADGELGFERDTGVLKCGNGVDSWVELVPIVKAVLAPTEAEWLTNTRILPQGEVGIARDTEVIKIGDGTKTWAQLPPLVASDFLTRSEAVAAYPTPDGNGGWTIGGQPVSISGGVLVQQYGDDLSTPRPSTPMPVLWFGNGLQPQNYSGVLGDVIFTTSTQEPSVDWLASLSASAIPVADGAAVSSWASSVNGYSLAQADSTKQPTKLAVVSEPSAVRFDGTRFLQGSYGTARTSPTTVVLAVRINTLPAANANKTILDSSSGAARQMIQVRAAATTSRIGLFGSAVLLSSTTVNAGEWLVISGIFDGANSVLRINGQQTAAGDTGTSGLSGATAGNIYTGAAGVGFVGDLAYVRQAVGRLSLTKLRQVEVYLGELVGLEIAAG